MSATSWSPFLSPCVAAWPCTLTTRIGPAAPPPPSSRPRGPLPAAGAWQWRCWILTLMNTLCGFCLVVVVVAAAHVTEADCLGHGSCAARSARRALVAPWARESRPPPSYPSLTVVRRSSPGPLKELRRLLQVKGTRRSAPLDHQLLAQGPPARSTRHHERATVYDQDRPAHGPSDQRGAKVDRDARLRRGPRSIRRRRLECSSGTVREPRRDHAGLADPGGGRARGKLGEAGVTGLYGYRRPNS